jgi:hypothetical protein
LSRSAHSAFLVGAAAVLCTFAWSARAEPTTAARKVEREAKRAEPVGGQFLGSEGRWQMRLPAAMGEGPPLLFMLSRAQLTSPRWGWELPVLARAMVEELAAVLDDGCSGCAVVARDVRQRLQDYLAADTVAGAPSVRNWVTDEDDPTWHRTFGIRVSAGPLAVDVDVDCSCRSEYVGMRGWNDVTTCDATVRERGRVLVRYLPRVRLGRGKLSNVFPLAAFSQTVQFPEGGQLLIESGYDYKGDGKEHRYEKDGIRGRVVVTGNLMAP